MESVKRHRPSKALLFALLLLAIALPLCPRIWNLKDMYLRGVLRSQVQTSLMRVVEDRGWLLSDVRLEAVSASSALLTHREHRRVPSEARCYSLDLAASALHPCVK